MNSIQPFSLFDPPPTGDAQPHSKKPIVLDPTELYDIPTNYIPITTDVEWLKFFGVSSDPCWVKGERLCDWAIAWLQAWNKMNADVEIKQDPTVRLASLFDPLSLPPEWSDKKQLLHLVNRLDLYPSENPIAYLLAEITSNEIWLTTEPTISHLAEWLAIPTPPECKPLEQVWQAQFRTSTHELAAYYQTPDKLLLLRRWLGIAEPSLSQSLGDYPLSVPDFLHQDFDQHWQQKILRSQGKVLDTLMPYKVAGMARIANCAYQIFRDHPDWLNQQRENKVRAFLNYQQKLELRDRQPPQQPQPLPLDANPQQALTWVTQSYLPFRRWELIIHQPPVEVRISDRLANSFVEWMVQHYPEMIIDSVECSNLNYNVASLIQNVCQHNPVLWIVIDGLGWLDHMELLSFLTQEQRLAVETPIQPRFSIIPTKTEYAKWSLYTQLLPNDPSWNADLNKAFRKMKLRAKRYTDSRHNELRQDLKEAKYQLYCWDTQQFDQLHHTERDWYQLYQIQRPHMLAGIAKTIFSLVEEYPNSEHIKVAIASDHGQILGISEKITCPSGLEPQGRIAIGTTDDSQFAVLTSQRYGLPHNISVIKTSASLNSFHYKTDKKILGSHGGLFPEEVVIGFSILQKSVQRLPVSVFCHGEGKPKQPGELKITIENLNRVELCELCLYIEELPSFQDGKSLSETIPPNTRITIQLEIPEVPELSPSQTDNRCSLTGELTFQFANAEAGRVAIAPDSTLIVHQIYTSGFNIDEFL